jgi:N-acetylglucosamine kinase-like BadF-type ATPase
MEELLAEAGYQRTLIRGDMVTAHAGALNGQPGVVAIAGTGSVYFGTSPDGGCLKLGGFGYAFGDEGGGYWIGTEALRAASKAYDQRAEPTRLVAALCQALGLEEFSQVPRLFYSRPMQPAQIAKLSFTVEAVAEKGDSVASQLLERAGHELAIGTTTLVRRLDYSAGCAVSYHGAILQECPIVLEAFKKHLALNIPSIRVQKPVFDALYGAYLLGRHEIESQERRGAPFS